MIEDGSLLIDPITMKITMRKGDTGNLCFRLSEPMEDCYFWFVVKTNTMQHDQDAPIYQKYDHVGGSLLLISISEEESDKLSGIPDASDKKNCLCSSSFRDYIWALKYAQKVFDKEGNVIGTGSVKTLIPRPMKRPPVFRVYPEIIEGPHI